MTGQTLSFPRDPTQEVRVPPDALRRLLVELLTSKAMFRFDAEAAADRMLEADLRGIQSHGSRKLEQYLAAMDAGEIDPRGQVLTVTETPAVAVLDGSRALGHVAATRAMQAAIEKARDVGTGTVAVRNSRPLGAASVYALLAANEGLIGHCITSSGGANVAAYGSRGPAVANNALAWTVPSRRGRPFVLDMACGATSWGKIDSYARYGRSLPDGVALDETGAAATDPSAAHTILPAAEARGFGLAFLASVLAGPLVGGRMPLHKHASSTEERSEHFVNVIDPRFFGDEDRFYRELEATRDEIRALEPADGFDRVRLPGDGAWEREQEYRRDGIPLHREHAEMLRRLAKQQKIDAPW